jgi:hypothetical protein
MTVDRPAIAGENHSPLSAHPQLKGPDHFPWLYPYSTKEDAEALWRDVEKLELHRQVAELEIKGLTVVPPEKFVGPERIHRALEAVLNVVERRFGFRPELEGDSHDNRKAPWELVHYLLLEDPVFQEIIIHPVTMALVTHLLGRNACLSSVMGLIKGPGGHELELHNDSHLIPPPLPSYVQVCNATVALTDYTLEGGPVCYVPGSHRLHRNPIFPEGHKERVAVEVPAGSLIFWGGNVWHGAIPRTAAGLRVNLLLFFARPHLRPEELYRYDVTPEMLGEMDPRFRTLLGFNIGYGWGKSGPSREPGLNFVSRSAFD